MLRKKVLIPASAGIAIATILAVIGLERLLDQGEAGAHWADAITAVSTGALVIVTTAYVLLTKNLAEIQARTLIQLTSAESDRVARRILEAIPPASAALYRAEQRFPINESTVPTVTAWKFTDMDDLDKAIDLMRITVLQLPAELESESIAAGIALMCAWSNIDGVETCIKAAIDRKGDNAVTWADVRAAFYEDASLRSQLSARDSMAEWADFAAGKYVTDGKRIADAYEDTLVEYLRRAA